ncbi:MAG: type I glyceraldehyde-3-phosphate dehydrogenase [Candidatus Margulisbacteria bacterium]|nr:type I glyceraldehyde-3-phosphate dehydrogenase [Candidatus Margulisiibacteriota bacterium]
MTTKVAINGFGRIGRMVFKVIQERDDIEVMAINDLTDAGTLAHLLKYDSIHGRFSGDVSSKEKSIIVNGTEIPIFDIKNPSELPWKELKIDVVIESTGIFTSAEGKYGGYMSHIEAGGQKVILTVPAKDNIKTIVMGVNDSDYTPDIKAVSNASCTTNCLAPIVKILHDQFGIVKGIMNTVHAFTSDQCLQDSPHKDLRRARAASQSIIPTTTGAAKAVTLVIPDLKGKLDGMAMRVPVPNGSITDFTCELDQSVSVEQINGAFKEASEGTFKGIVEYTNDPIVSVDIIGNTHSSIVDAQSTMVIDNLVKVVAWYDNEVGYSNRIIDLIELTSKAHEPQKVTAESR